MSDAREWDYIRLASERGGNLGMWCKGVELQTERIREAVAADRVPGAAEDIYRLDIDAHFLLVAIRNGVRLAEQLRMWIPDARLIAALDEFPQRFPHEKNLRDALTHLDEYVRDKGRLQKTGDVAPGSFSWLKDAPDGDVVLTYGPFEVPLLAIGAAASDLLRLAVDVWSQGLRDNVDGVDDVDFGL